MLFLRFFLRVFWWLTTLALLQTSSLFGGLFRRYMATYFRWGPAPLDF
jgi:hypothetical protein